MTFSTAVLASFVTLAASLSVAAAQDHSVQDHATHAVLLPEACQLAEAPKATDMKGMHAAMESMRPHQKAFMTGMMKTEGPMMQGMMAEDPDVAFLCAMIPHHQGAIEMAQVELEHGDNDAARAMARKIMEAQVKEIAEMTKMIEDAAK